MEDGKMASVSNGYRKTNIIWRSRSCKTSEGRACEMNKLTVALILFELTNEAVYAILTF